jgi:hypothetical protein
MGSDGSYLSLDALAEWELSPQVGTGKPCSARLEGSFDLRRFNVSFWQNYERCALHWGGSAQF